MSASTNIGHNNPPPEAAFDIHVSELFTLLSDTLTLGDDGKPLPVTTAEQEASIDSLMDDFRKASKDADTARATEKKPHDEAGKAVQAKWKPIIDKANKGVSACKAALEPYRVEQQRIKNEAIAKAREEAAAKERAAQEAMRQSDNLEAQLMAEADFAAAKKLTAAANRAERGPTGLRTHWEAQIADKTAALKHYLATQPDEFVALIQTLADRVARANRPVVPGVIYHEQKRAA